jgi:beta-glucosidase
MLFHHTWPEWVDKQGAFENPATINDFVNFSVYVFKHLHTKVTYWMTINEPEGYAMQGYYRGEYPPGKRDLALAGKVLLNFLNAHIAVYKEFKKIDSTVSIGFAKVVQPIDPYNSWNPVERLATSMFDRLFNDTSLEFFKTGKFSWRIPGYVHVSDENKLAPQSLDFLGINYYSHTSIRLNLRLSNIFTPAVHPGERCTDDGKVIYPQGLLCAIERCAILQRPMHITENGLADEQSKYMDEFFRSHIAVVENALNKGYDIRSYHVWTLMDNYEWAHGYKIRYGLYAVNRQTQERTLRPGAYNLVNFIKAQTEQSRFEDKSYASGQLVAVQP